MTLFCSAYLVAKEDPVFCELGIAPVNNGFTMSEVAAFARNIDWSEDVAPAARFFSRSNNNTENIEEIFDFQWADYYEAGMIIFKQSSSARINNLGEEAP